MRLPGDREQWYGAHICTREVVHNFQGPLLACDCYFQNYWLKSLQKYQRISLSACSSIITCFFSLSRVCVMLGCPDGSHRGLWASASGGAAWKLAGPQGQNALTQPELVISKVPLGVSSPSYKPSRRDIGPICSQSAGAISLLKSGMIYRCKISRLKLFNRGWSEAKMNGM